MNKIARDYLGGTYYRKVILKSHPRGQGGGIFWEEFNHGKNTGKACVTEWAKRGAIFMPFIRVQGLWAGSSHNYNGQATKALKIGEELSKIAFLYPNTHFFYSPYCEANTVDQPLLNKLRSEFPLLTIVHTANKGAPLAKNGILNETHGDYHPPQADCYSYDGLSCVNADSELFKQMIPSLVYFMYWTSSDNGRRNDSIKPPPPSIPNRKHWTSVKMNKSIQYQSELTRAADDLPNKWLWKSHGDPDTTPNPTEDNKGVLLCPLKAAKAELINESGKVVQTLKYSGVSHEDGRHIYRANRWGFEIAKKGRKLRLRMDGKIKGKIDPGFRINEYRNHL